MRFTIMAGKSASNGNPILVTNYNVNKKEKFEREKHRKKKYLLKANISFDLDFWGNASCNLEISTPGAYSYHIEYGNSSKSITGYFVVDPILTITDKHVPIEGIVMKTIIPKWMPEISQWHQFFSTASSLGYNAIHYAPMQEVLLAIITL